MRLTPGRAAAALTLGMAVLALVGAVGCGLEADSPCAKCPKDTECRAAPRPPGSLLTARYECIRVVMTIQGLTLEEVAAEVE